MNMKKQWRRELAEMKRAKNSIRKVSIARNKKLRSLIRSFEKQISRNRRACFKQSDKLDRRIAILEGRLS
jgi:hypothetical protein